jgi:Protein of unknown function (DUF3618)
MSEQERATVDQRKDGPEEIRHDIEQTREELGDTVDALSHKADVKTQLKSKVEEGKEALREKQQEAKVKGRQLGEQARERPAPVGVAAGLAALVLVLFVIRRRR